MAATFTYGTNNTAENSSRKQESGIFKCSAITLSSSGENPEKIREIRKKSGSEQRL
jgi:hypothetical protein